jgi:hypothetical protein
VLSEDAGGEGGLVDDGYPEVSAAGGVQRGKAEALGSEEIVEDHCATNAAN